MTATNRIRQALFDQFPEIECWSERPSFEQSHWASPHLRTVLVAKMRWVVLALLSTCGLYTAALFRFNRIPIFLTRTQFLFLLAALVLVSSYNLLFQFGYGRLQRFSCIDQAQIALDLLFVTVVIHFSGGAVSWLWPVYLLITIEAAFLLQHQRDVWVVGAVGGALYGLLLAGSWMDAIPPVHMPFLPETLAHDGLFLLLTWCWVAVLNATVALITGYLMSVIREEHLAYGLSQQRLQNFVDNANDLIFSCSPDGRFVFVNPRWRDLMGYGAEELAAMRFQDVVDLDQRSRQLIDFRRALDGEKGTLLEGNLISKHGTRISVEGHITCTFRDGAPQVVWYICRDVTDRKAAETKLDRLAHFDSLTGLPNRVTSVDRIESALTVARRDGKQAAILYLDLDRFKLINDTLGHSAGDELLKDVGLRLRESVREVDTVSRMDGDEFLVALGYLDRQKDVRAIAGKLLKPLERPFQIEGHEVFISASMGISIYPQDGDDPHILIKKADIAMYHAKRGGRNNLMFYEPDMDEHANLRLRLVHDLRRALEQDEFLVYYQPKHHPGTCEITSMEALVRWKHPELGLLGPNEFIPLAEETGLILLLGEWVLRHVARQHSAWRREGLPPLRVGVNLSGYQLQQPVFPELVRSILAVEGMSPDCLEFEITETVIMQNPDLAARVLREFMGMGIRIAIDDFGTGFSSLAHIKRFSVSCLKIDKSFVKDLERNPTDAAIATAIFAMAANLNLEVVAEGVETLGQLDFMRDKCCDEVQGYLFSKPLPAEKIPHYMSTHLTRDDHSRREWRRALALSGG